MLAPSEIEAIAGLPINRDESAPQVGQTWAWRSGDGSLVGVTVLQWGRRITPPRFGCVKVRFPDGQPEAEGWVRPDRLVSRWAELDSYLAKQTAWERVSAANPAKDSPEEAAAHQVFDLLVPRRVAQIQGQISARGPVLVVHDAQHLARLTGLPESVWAQDPAGFRQSDGSTVASWTATYSVAQAVARRNSEVLLKSLDADEAHARYEAVNGIWVYESRSEGARLVASPREAEENDLSRSSGKPMRDILRQWCEGAQDLLDTNQLEIARRDLVAVRKAAWRAVQSMNRAGLTGPAEQLAHVLMRHAARGASQ